MSKPARSRRVLDNEEFKTLEIHRQLWRRLNTGEEQVVVTEEQVDLEVIFGNYFPVFNMYMNRGLLKVITIDELPEDQHEFTVIK
jgi:hypothetical protein